MEVKNTSFSVGKHFVRFIEAQVAQGRYANASDVVRAGLRLLEQQEAQLAALRAALIEGEGSGVSELTLEDIWEEVKQEARHPASHG